MLPFELIRLAEERVAVLQNIVIQHPRLLQAHSRFESLIQHARCNPTGEKQCMALIAPTQSGKSTIIRTFIKEKNTEGALAERRIPVLDVTLKGTRTRKSFAQDILFRIAEFGYETGPHTGSEGILLERVRTYLRDANVELLVVDEFHHLVQSDNARVLHTVGETIKWMLITGVCPIVLAGIEDARKPFQANSQLSQRAVPSVELTPLSAANPAELKLFADFMLRYLLAIEKSGVARNASALRNGDIPPCFMEMSDGVLGIICNLLKEAVRIMTYGGRDELTRDDLCEAADAFVRDGKCERNPLRNGLKPLSIAA
jgi:hypothetical protein